MFDSLAYAGFCMILASTGLEKIWLSPQKNKVAIFYYFFSTQSGTLRTVRGGMVHSSQESGAEIAKSISTPAIS